MLCSRRSSDFVEGGWISFTWKIEVRARLRVKERNLLANGGGELLWTISLVMQIPLLDTVPHECLPATSNKFIIIPSSDDNVDFCDFGTLVAFISSPYPISLWRIQLLIRNHQRRPGACSKRKYSGEGGLRKFKTNIEAEEGCDIWPIYIEHEG